MRIKNKIVPTLTNLNLRNLNDIITEIFREINKVSKSAEEITFRINEKGQRELIINDKGKEYRDVTGVAVFDINNVESLKNKAKTKVKENLEIDKVTNESKSTMFTNPSFTGSGTIATNIDNEVRIGAANDADNHLVVYAPLDNSAMLVFRDMAGGSISDRWSIGYRYGSNTVLRINPSKTVASADVLSLTSAGNLSVDGTSTIGSIANAASDTDKFLVSDSGTVKYRTGAEVLSDIGAGASAGSSDIVTTGALNSGSITSGFGNIDNGSSTIATGEITSGAVVWQRFQFYIIGGNTSRFYYLDHDDRYNSLAHWDNYSTILGIGTNLTMLDERMSAFPEVAENCIFAGGIGTIYNDTGTDNPKISIYYDDSTLSGDEDTTESFASLVDTDVTINTQDRKYGFTLDAVTGTTLNAGCKYVPTVSNIATSVWGSMTLKFITK